MKGDELYLRHIVDALTRIETYTSVGREEFMTTPHWQDAVIRQLEIVGEATKQLSDDLRTAHPDIPWRRIAGLPDVLIHRYMSVDLDAVWTITQTEGPRLKQRLLTILESGQTTPEDRAS